MPSSLIVVDNFCAQIGAVRQSALDSGFGKWAPNKGEVGSSIYEGMNFWGLHSVMLQSLSGILGAPVYPNNMFFRVTNEGTEEAYVHSDRQWGQYTCVAYLSEHKETVSGTGFFRHRKTGWTQMPTLEEMQQLGILEQMKDEMVKGSEKDWEQLDFVRGLYNRAVIFQAPLFHARCPRTGIASDMEQGRMVWACHFNLI